MVKVWKHTQPPFQCNIKGEKVRCDFHCHTRYSDDSLLTPEEVVRTAFKFGLDAVAITDHNTFSGVSGALAAATGTDVMVVPGMEVRTEMGDIIGLFLKKEVTARNFKELIEEIRHQNGLVMLPHPFKMRCLTKEIMTEIDVVEIFNARCTLKENHYAIELARKFGKPGIFGSDTHLKREMGRGYCEIDATADFHSMKAGILKGAIAFRETYSSPWNILFSQMVKIFRTGRIPSPMKILKGLGHF